MATAAVPVATLAALVEWGIVLEEGTESPAPVLGLLLGLWCVFFAAVTAVGAVALRLFGGPNAEQRARQHLRETPGRWWRQRTDEGDIVRSARLLGTVIGLAGWWGAAFVTVRYLVVDHHDPALISAAATTGIVVWALLAFGLGVLLQRGLAMLGRRLPWWPPFVAWAGIVLAAIASSAVVAAITHWETIAATPLPAIAAALGAVVVHAAAWVSLRERRLHAVWQGVALVASLGLVAAASFAPGARASVTRHAPLARHLYAGVWRLADFDRDGIAGPPLGNDCAPFDPHVHPLAREVPDNSVDENCDGLDHVPKAADRAKQSVEAFGLTLAPDVLLITVDTLRADHLGAYGYHRPTSPDLDELAARGALFLRAYSQDSGTAPSMWSLMSGQTPFQVSLDNADEFPPKIGSEETTLAEHMQERGYHTVGRPCAGMFRSGNWNIDRGFADFEEVCNGKKRRRAEGVTDHALRVLEDVYDRDEPYFMWVHYYDPHQPYVDHADIDFGRRPIDRYDEDIRYVQEHIARLIRDVLERERDVYVFVTADHGEAFGEHGDAPHARTLYREVTHVPLIVLGSEVESRRVETPVAVGDVFPTTLHLAGIPIPADTTMTSLVPTLRGGPPPPQRPIFQENSYSRPRRHVKGVIWKDHHLIRDLTQDTWELYDLVQDPNETRDLAGRGLEVEETMREQMRRFVPTTHLPEELR